MKPIVLTADEAQRAAAGTLTEVRRPVDMRGIRETAWVTRCTVDQETHEAEFSGDVDYFVRRVACPFGAPGAPLWGKEACNLPSWEDDPSEVVYKADCVDPVARLVEIQECADGTARWTPAAKMPKWAARFTFVNCTSRAEHVDGAWTWVVAVERLNRPDGSPMPPREVKP